MESAGFWMLGLVALGLVTTGLPAFVVLIGIAVLFAAVGVAAGFVSYHLLAAVPARITGLLESDILQALPLYVLMGALLNRLPLADILFRAGARSFAGTRAAPLLAALGLGALLAPMSGSVGASVSTLSRIVQPKLVARGVPRAQSLAVVCVASTFGVVVPPSLVLILLGDAMLRAHSEAIAATGIMARAINTQDVFRGALVPSAIFLALSVALAWWIGRGAPREMAIDNAGQERLTAREWLTALLTLALIVALLAAVVLGYVYAVEGAAAGGFALVLFGIATGVLGAETLRLVLRDTMAVTGALFALFVAATSFTLVFRAFGTDRVLATIVLHLPGGMSGTVIVVLALLWLCAFVLDAFEIIFVIVPLVMPPLIMRAPDAVWVSVLALLALQSSFLLPPFGYAVMMARARLAANVALAPLARALAPFLAAQILVLGLTVAYPWLTHIAEPAVAFQPPLSDDEVRRRLEDIAPSAAPDGD
jgi:TRAP-type mannitol/chloroaromatic compound transport system permease large subunit